MSTELTDQQMDDLINGIDLDNVHIDESTGDIGDVVESEIPIKNDQTSKGNEPFKFTANGKEIVATDTDKLKTWASMGYNYGQHMEQFKKQQDEFNSRMNEYNQKYSLYEQIDKKAAENPQWWEHVQKSFNSSQPNEQKSQSLTNDGDKKLSPELQSMKEEFNKEIEELRQFKNEVTARENAKREEMEDNALKQEIQSIRDNHPDLNWTTPDSNGKTLEYKVLEYAHEKGINSFDVAFTHLMHKELIAKTHQKALDQARKEIQRTQKLGLLGESPDSIKKVFEQADSKSKSWDELEHDALQELGIAN